MIVTKYILNLILLSIALYSFTYNSLLFLLFSVFIYEPFRRKLHNYFASAKYKFNFRRFNKIVTKYNKLEVEYYKLEESQNSDTLIREFEKIIRKCQKCIQNISKLNSFGFENQARILATQLNTLIQSIQTKILTGKLALEFQNIHDDQLILNERDKESFIKQVQSILDRLNSFESNLAANIASLFTFQVEYLNSQMSLLYLSLEIKLRSYFLILLREFRSNFKSIKTGEDDIETKKSKIEKLKEEIILQINLLHSFQLNPNFKKLKSMSSPYKFLIHKIEKEIETYTAIKIFYFILFITVSIIFYFLISKYSLANEVKNIIIKLPNLLSQLFGLSFEISLLVCVVLFIVIIFPSIESILASLFIGIIFSSFLYAFMNTNQLFQSKHYGKLFEYNHIKKNTIYEEDNNKEIIRKDISSYGYEFTKSVVYRSEGYTSFPHQEKYIKKYGILSKRLVAEIIKENPLQLQSDCNLDQDLANGKYYEQAYKIIEKKPLALHQAEKSLLKKLANELVQISNDPVHELCVLHTGTCMWESFLISTAEYGVAVKYRGSLDKAKTYQITPKGNNTPLLFDVGDNCGETKDAAVIRISPEEYKIKEVR